MIAEKSNVDVQHQSLVRDRFNATRAPRAVTDIEAGAHELMLMAAHDLRSPLAAIKWKAAPIIERWKAGEEPVAREWAAVVTWMCGAVDDAFGMINDMLAFERLDQSGEIVMALRPIDIEALIDKALTREREALERARCQVVVVRQKGLERVRGRWDGPYLLRVFGNLLRNAASHAPGTPVQITLARRGDRLGIVFADSGPGLRDRRAIPRYDLPTTSTAAAAHGLGLWIVRRSIDRLGGRMRIDTRPGHGLAFDIELPGLEP